MSEPAANSQYDTHLSPQQQNNKSTSTCQAVTPKPHPQHEIWSKKLTKASLYLVENCKPKEGKLH